MLASPHRRDSPVGHLRPCHLTAEADVDPGFVGKRERHGAQGVGIAGGGEMGGGPGEAGVALLLQPADKVGEPPADHQLSAPGHPIEADQAAGDVASQHRGLLEQDGARSHTRRHRSRAHPRRSPADHAYVGLQRGQRGICPGVLRQLRGLVGGGLRARRDTDGRQGGLFQTSRGLRRSHQVWDGPRRARQRRSFGSVAQGPAQEEAKPGRACQPQELAPRGERWFPLERWFPRLDAIGGGVVTLWHRVPGL